jgi:hypothetical protein
MKKFILVISALTMFVSIAQADIKAGQKAYLKLFKTSFGMNGTRFAADHSVAEWEALFADNAKGFIKEYGERFPKAAPVLNNPDMAAKLQDIGDFAKEYGNDSDNVPSCG